MTVRMPIPEGATKFFVVGLSGITGSVAKQTCYSSYELISGDWRHIYSRYVSISVTSNDITIANAYDGSASVDVTVTFIISS